MKIMNLDLSLGKRQVNAIYGVAIALCFIPSLSPAVALCMGILLSLLGIKHKGIVRYTSFSLKASIVLMGFSMNLMEVATASKSGFIDTAISVVFVMISGILLTKALKLDYKTGLLISAGTAICGGSAIAAIAPVLNAKSHQISFSLVVIFILNGVALVIFPIVGHHFNLSQYTFGTWAAVAIHDTSSVVGAGAIYGPEALQVATTVKLIRALWIVPLSVTIAYFQRDKESGGVKIPWFIGLFIISIVIAYIFPSAESTFAHLSWLGRRGMVIALLLIGSNISIADAKKAGVKSFILGVLLWLLIGVSSFVVLTTYSSI